MSVDSVRATSPALTDRACVHGARSMGVDSVRATNNPVDALTARVSTMQIFNKTLTGCPLGRHHGSTGRPLRIAADFAGMDMPSLALRDLRVPATCVYAAECDARARAFLDANIGPCRLDHDVRGRDLAALPAFDGYLAGSPCPAFSAAGLRLGTDAPDGQGLLVWQSVAVILARRPTFFVLEQVRGFTAAHGGELFRSVLAALEAPGVYAVSWSILDTKDNGLPHHRERLYVVGLLKAAAAAPFCFPSPVDPLPLTDLLDPRIATDDFRRLPGPVALQNRSFAPSWTSAPATASTSPRSTSRLTPASRPLGHAAPSPGSLA